MSGLEIKCRECGERLRIEGHRVKGDKILVLASCTCCGGCFVVAFGVCEVKTEFWHTIQEWFENRWEVEKQ